MSTNSEEKLLNATLTIESNSKEMGGAGSLTESRPMTISAAMTQIKNDKSIRFISLNNENNELVALMYENWPGAFTDPDRELNRLKQFVVSNPTIKFIDISNCPYFNQEKYKAFKMWVAEHNKGGSAIDDDKLLKDMPTLTPLAPTQKTVSIDQSFKSSDADLASGLLEAQTLYSAATTIKDGSLIDSQKGPLLTQTPDGTQLHSALLNSDIDIKTQAAMIVASLGFAPPIDPKRELPEKFTINPPIADGKLQQALDDHLGALKAEQKQSQKVDQDKDDPTPTVTMK